MHWNLEWHWSMMVGMALFWFVVIVAVVVAIKYLSTQWQPGRKLPEDTPETILKRRYASGQIERDEYERRLEELRK